MSFWLKSVTIGTFWRCGTKFLSITCNLLTWNDSLFLIEEQYCPIYQTQTLFTLFDAEKILLQIDHFTEKILSQVFIPVKSLTFWTWHSWIQMLSFWNYCYYGALLLPWHPQICGIICATWMMGLRLPDGCAGGEGEPWQKCFLTGFYPPRPSALVQWEEQRHLLFIPFPILTNTSLPPPQTTDHFDGISPLSVDWPTLFFSLSMFLMVICLQPSWAAAHAPTTNWVNHLVDSQCTWRQSNSGHFLAWPSTTLI